MTLQHDDLEMPSEAVRALLTLQRITDMRFVALIGLRPDGDTAIILGQGANRSLAARLLAVLDGSVVTPARQNRHRGRF